jgi:hypothetical protein
VARPPSSRRRKLLLALALLAGGYLVPLLAANLFLGTPLGPWAINRRPQSFQVTWQRAWCLVPGRLQVRGLKVAGHTATIDWWISAERGEGWIDLPALFSRRFRVVDFSGAGIRSSTVRRETARPAGKRRAPRRPWRIEMRGVSLTAVRSIGWNDFRLEGNGTARGAFSLIIGGDFSLSPTVLEMSGARLLLKEEAVARDLVVQADGGIAPYAPRRYPGVAGFDFITGALRARGTTDRGDLAVDLRLDRGRLAPGSRASLRAGAPLRAELTVEPSAAGPQLVFRGDGQGLRFGRILAADAAHLEAATSETRFSRLLAQGRELRRTGRLAGGALVAAFSAAGLHLASSTERLSWQLTADHGSGWIDLPALLRRQLLLDRVQADGLAVRIEKNREKPPPAGRGMWAVRVTEAQLTGFREVAFQDLRLDGLRTIAGGLALDPAGIVTVDPLNLQVVGGRVTRGGDVLARDLLLAAEAHLGPWPFRAQPGLAGLDALSGTLQARGKTATLPFLTLDGRTGHAGDFALDLRLDQGRLSAGTHAALRSGKSLQITGDVKNAQGARLFLEAEAKGLTLGGGNGYPPVLRAGVAALRTAAPERGLRRLLSTAEELQAGRLTGRPWTGEMDLRSFQVNGLGERLVWRLAAERGRARIDLSALLGRRILLTGVRVEGATVQLDPAAGPPPAVPVDKRWAVEMPDTQIVSLRSLAWQSDRLLGPGKLEGSLTFDRSRLLTVRRAALTVPAGALESGGARVARRIALRAEVRVAPFVPGAIRGAALLRLLSGAVTVQGQVSSLGFLQRYLQKASWLQVQGQGRLDTELRLEAGRLLAGSRLDVRGNVRAVFLDSAASGEAVLTGEVEAGAAAMRVSFADFAIAPLPRMSSGGGEAPTSYIQGNGLRLAIASTDLDLATPVSDLRAAVDLPDGEVPDLTVYNAYLPPDTGVSLLSGTGRLRLHLDLNAATQTARGEVLLTSGAMRVRFQDVELAGNLLLRAQLAGRDLKARRFQIAGTRLDLDRVTYREIGEAGEAGAESPDWWAHLQLTDGTMVWGRPLSLQSAALLEMKSSGFLLAVFARKKNFLRWFHRLLSVEDVRAEGTIRCGDGAIEIAPLRVTGGRLDLRSRLRFTRSGRQGDLFLRWGKLAAGIELRDGKRTYKLRHPEEWFEQGREPD